MLNRFSYKQSFQKGNSTIGFFHKNPYRVKRTYNAMIEQDHSIPSTVNFASKRLLQNDSKPPESLIKFSKPRIPEKLLKEIERYNYQRYQFNVKVTPCPCDEH